MKRQGQSFIRLLSLLLVTALTAAVCLVMGGCGKKSGPGAKGTGAVTEKTVTVKVTDDRGEETVFTVTTTADTLRGVLEQEGLASGDEGPYGLYVKTVNGVTADYDANGAYWSFQRNGKMLMTGVDDTPVADGDVFAVIYTG